MRAASTGNFALPKRCRRTRALGERSGAGGTALAAGSGVEREDNGAERDEHERQRAGRRDAERHLELGEDLGGEGLVAEDLEGAVLREQHEGDEHAAAEDGPSDLAERHPEERPDPTDAEAPRRLLEPGVRGTEARCHRQVHERVDGKAS